jgi:hypothetical protein
LVAADDAKLGNKDDYAALKSVLNALTSRSQNADRPRLSQKSRICTEGVRSQRLAQHPPDPAQALRASYL